MRISALLAIALGMTHESLIGPLDVPPQLTDECEGGWYWLTETYQEPLRYRRVMR
jgi:hypothetical protein